MLQKNVCTSIKTETYYLTEHFSEKKHNGVCWGLSANTGASATESPEVLWQILQDTLWNLPANLLIKLHKFVFKKAKGWHSKYWLCLVNSCLLLKKKKMYIYFFLMFFHFNAFFVPKPFAFKGLLYCIFVFLMKGWCTVTGSCWHYDHVLYQWLWTVALLFFFCFHAAYLQHLQNTEYQHSAASVCYTFP